MKLKAIKMIFEFRLFAIFDVVFKSKFEIQTWNKDGSKSSKTRFDKQEILDKIIVMEVENNPYGIRESLKAFWRTATFRRGGFAGVLFALFFWSLFSGIVLCLLLLLNLTH